MTLKGFDFEEERIKQEISKLDAKRVLIQLPEGLKPQAPRLASIVEKTGALPIISADPCYGACDISTSEAESLGVDLILHFGHSRMFKHEKVSTIYIETRAAISIEEAINKSLGLLAKYKTIGLTTTVQHLQNLDIARELLVRAGKTVVIGDAGRTNYSGQVTGCDYSNAKSITNEVDAFLFIGGGQFHALGIYLATSKPTIIADPYDNRAFAVDSLAQKTLKQRWACIEEAKQAKTYGILVGLKPGQKHLEAALEIKSKIEKNKKPAYLFALREVSPEVILEFPTVDAYVNTACPRISLEAPSKFSKPILTMSELKVVFGEDSWENLLKNGLFED
ncbi:TPA: diphthamide biosynthesis enzyme Dph2 [Candidatus Bathyarchaeota archaeon]|nr:diphthamide biosynthesis enzyme Dph2 [Candidatus Bathyarchaeota archaeon]